MIDGCFIIDGLGQARYPEIDNKYLKYVDASRVIGLRVWAVSIPAAQADARGVAHTGNRVG